MLYVHLLLILSDVCIRSAFAFATVSSIIIPSLIISCIRYGPAVNDFSRQLLLLQVLINLNFLEQSLEQLVNADVLLGTSLLEHLDLVLLLEVLGLLQ